MKRFSYMMMAFAVLACSEFHQPHFKEVVELVPAEGAVYVSKEGGDASLHVYSNGRVTCRMIDETISWASVMGESSFVGDGDVHVTLERNESYRRMFQVEVTVDDGKKTDTLEVYQYGIDPQLECHESYAALDGSRDNQVTFPIMSNIRPEDIDLSVEYIKGDAEWINDLKWEDGWISIRTVSTQKEDVSLAVVKLVFPDGWNQEVETELRITRSGCDGSFGQMKSFEELRSLALEDGFEVEEDIYLEGLVVSSCKSPNMELNPSVDYNKVDTLENARTAYIQSRDGRYGFRLKFDHPQDNILMSGSQMKISLNGAVLVKESDPERYTISSLESSNMIGGIYNVPVPEKTRTISGLLPEDIYTFVTVRDVEFVNKSGSYTNVREDYSLPSSFNETQVVLPMDGWASLLLDGEGRGIYAMVNMLCPWRRTGDGVPQGKGTVSGILVHHDHKRYGDMGDYQIRVLDESGFQMEQEAGYSAYLKWTGEDVGDAKTYCNPVENNSGAEARLHLENKESSVSSGTIRAVQSYEKLTTGGNATLSKKSIGLQVMLEGWYREDEDGAMIPENGIMGEFSTETLTSSQRLVAYVSFCASGVIGDPSTFKNYPVHWCLEYSLDGETFEVVSPAVKTGKDYVHARTSPWTSGYVGSTQYLTSIYAGMGFTDHIFTLPAQTCGQEKIFVRFRPYDDFMASLPVEWDGEIETARIKSNTTYANDVRFAQITVLVK